MTPPSDDELKETRAALAPTLDATAAILPWVAKPQELRYPPEKTERWQAASQTLHANWSDRYQNRLAGFRPAVFALCAVALELADVDLLRLTEALASAADALEEPRRQNDPRLIAAISAACECLMSEGGIEQDGFPALARHASARLEQVLTSPVSASVRTPTLDHLFVSEAGDCLDRMHEALEQLPADTYAVKLAAEELADLADPLELDTIALLARALAQRLCSTHGEHPDLDEPFLRAEVETRITELGVQIDEIADQATGSPTGR